MRVLLSTIGTRGDVQPLVALGLQLRELGREVHFCVPPDFREWIEGYGFSVTHIGPELKSPAGAAPPIPPAPPTPEQLRQIAEGAVATQFDTLATAARGCNLIVGATALQLAAPSVAERLGIPYVFAAYCPTVLPSPHHPPIPLPMHGPTGWSAGSDNRKLWEKDAQSWNAMWGAALNSRREKLGLTPVDDVRSHIFTIRPWLAADATLAPWPDPGDTSVVQTGAWILQDQRPLSLELQRFLDGGEAPVYFGFGSTRAPQELGRVMVETARTVGRRAIMSHGWAELSPIDAGPDCLTIGEVNLMALFPRVAAVVHHGGAGTTTLAARAGAPQVVLPQIYDQPYWARRVAELGIGSTHAPAAPTLESLAGALEPVLQASVKAQAEAVAAQVGDDGATAAAGRLVEMN